LGAVDYIFSPIVPDILRAKVSVFVDLFEKTEAAKRLFLEAQEASRAKSEFLNLAAHELRTPLSVVVGYASMLSDGSLGPVPDKWRFPLEILNSKASELNRLVDELLLASRIETGHLPTRLVQIDLRDAIAEAVDRNLPLAEMLGGEVVAEVPRRPVHVRTDSDHLARILDNLVRNGLSYNSGTPHVKVSLTAGPRPRIAVEDDGVGIAPDYRDRIFERFYRINDAMISPQPGTGLGLYISRDLAHRLGASLVLERSELGKGSTFALELDPAAALRPNGASHRDAERSSLAVVEGGAPAASSS
jgi:signal transduction histidine kinase